MYRDSYKASFALTPLLIFWIVVAVAIVGGLGYVSLTYWQPWAADRRTEITRNTNQYVTTQQEMILDGLRRYNDPDAMPAQQNSAVLDMCRAATRIDDEYVPTETKSIMRQQGCWNGA